MASKRWKYADTFMEAGNGNLFSFSSLDETIG